MDRTPGVHERLARRQAILNERPIPPRRLQHQECTPIPVRVRLVWERDGEQWVDTRARDWVGRDVLCDVNDRRWPVGGVWLDAGDMERR